MMNNRINGFEGLKKHYMNASIIIKMNTNLFPA